MVYAGRHKPIQWPTREQAIAAIPAAVFGVSSGVVFLWLFVLAGPNKGMHWLIGFHAALVVGAIAFFLGQVHEEKRWHKIVRWTMVLVASALVALVRLPKPSINPLNDEEPAAIEPSPQSSDLQVEKPD